jgi:hypothetical protein
VAYHEEEVLGQLDATGSALIPLGPLSQKGVHFLGYLVCKVGDGTAGATYELQTKQGRPLAYASGLEIVLGPVQILANDHKMLKVTAGPASVALSGMLTGDKNENFEDLLVRPTPTSGNPAPQSVVFTGKNLTAGTEAGQVVAATVGGVVLDLTANTKSTSYLTNPGPLRIQLSSSAAAGVNVIFATLYTDDIAVVAEPMLLKVFAPDGAQNLNVLTLQHT